MATKNQNGRQKTKFAAKLLSFQAKSLKFCMELYLDHPQPKSEKKIVCQKMAAKKQNGRHKLNLSINRSIFKLKGRNFACK